jgi:hypothetical protein
MITRAERLRLFQFYARERDCVLCKNWPRAEKPHDVGRPLISRQASACDATWRSGTASALSATVRKNTKPSAKLAAKNDANHQQADALVMSL